jgi:hypothetical protein
MKLNNERMVKFFKDSSFAENGLDLFLPDDLALLHNFYGIKPACIFFPA